MPVKGDGRDYLARSVERVPYMVTGILKLEGAHPAPEYWTAFILCAVALFISSRFSGWWIRYKLN